MTRKEKWKSLHPKLETEFDKYHRCPYWDLDLKEYDCEYGNISCKDCWEKEYDEGEVIK